MHPNLFLRTFWRMEYRAEVFVAMSFAGEYQDRFEQVIKQAILSVKWNGRQLSATRVDLSKTGDSVLTDIIDGIAHAVVVLADVSTLGHDSKSGLPYRNGNVMYEVGLALACRQPSEVLLIKDDHDQFLFDVSTIPHLSIDFTNQEQARDHIKAALIDRLSEREHINDARVSMAASRITPNERNILEWIAAQPADQLLEIPQSNVSINRALARLLDNQIITMVGVGAAGRATIRSTPLGQVIAQNLDSLVPKMSSDGAAALGQGSSDSSAPERQETGS